MENNELLPVVSKPTFKVVDEEGREIVRPDVMQAVTQLASLAQLVRIRKSLEKEEFEGKVDTITLSATDGQACLNLLDRWYYTALISAFVINDGPDTAYIGINEPYNWLKIKINETRTLDYTKADRRIERIYYKCDLGETASVRIEGIY